MFARWLGQLVGRALAAIVKRKVTEKVQKLEDKVEAAAKDLSNVAKVLLVAALGVSLTGATCAREFGIGVAQGAAGCIADPNCGKAQTPTPAATPEPTEAIPTVPSTPSQTPYPTPTLAPTTPIPTATPSPTPEPQSCAPKPPASPVSLKFSPRCPRGFEPLDFQDDPTLCAVKAGEGNKRTAWRLGYGLFRQNLKLIQVGDKFLQFDEGRGCTDAYGRFFPDCEHLYEHPEGASAPYSFGGYVVPEFCPEVTPTPVPTPAPGTPQSPLMVRWKIGGFGQDCKLGNICCHNSEDSPLFQNRHICEVGSTQLFDYADPEKRQLKHSGPCDPDHQITWNNVCGQRDWDIVGGPGLEVRGAAVGYAKSEANPHHTFVEFIPGQCFEICAYAPVNPKTTDGLTVEVAPNNMTCSTHCY